MPAMPAAMPKELPAVMPDGAAAVMGLSKLACMAALLPAAMSKLTGFATASLCDRPEVMGKAELPPVATPVKEGKTGLLPSFPGFVFEPRLILGDSTFLQCAAAKNSHALRTSLHVLRISNTALRVLIVESLHHETLTAHCKLHWGKAVSCRNAVYTKDLRGTQQRSHIGLTWCNQEKFVVTL